MVLTINNAWPLVGKQISKGGKFMALAQPSWTIKVTRAFYYNGEPQKVGKILTVPAGFGAEMVSFNKAEKVESYQAPTTPSAEKDVKKKEEK
jgi:hypothetical protein